MGASACSGRAAIDRYQHVMSHGPPDSSDCAQLLVLAATFTSPAARMWRMCLFTQRSCLHKAGSILIGMQLSLWSEEHIFIDTSALVLPPALLSDMPLCRSMMTAVQLAQAQLAVALCCANILVSFALCKLSLEMRAHSKLLTSHKALTKQAAGISQEYTRATKVDPNVSLKEQLNAATARCSNMQVRML